MEWMVDETFAQYSPGEEVLLWVTVKLSPSSPEFCSMKLRMVSPPGSMFLLLAAISVALSAMNETVR